MDNIYLIGFMGAGKTTISQSLYKRLKDMEYTLIDTDEKIKALEDMDIFDIFKKKGEEYFRDAETALLAELSGKKKVIVSCGGGMVLRQENVSYMKEGGSVVLLRASSEVIYNRVSQNSSRPLLSNVHSPKDIQKMMDERWPYYERAYDICVSSDTSSPYATAALITDKLGIPYVFGNCALISS